MSIPIVPLEPNVPLEVVDLGEKQKKSLDDHLEETIGGFGKFQAVVLFFTCLPLICVAVHVMSWTFVGNEQIFPRNTSIYHQWGIEPENRPKLKATIQSFYFAGQLVGSYTTGIMGDTYGRKFAMYICLFLQSVCGVLLSFAPNWWSFGISKFGTGFSHSGLYSITILYGLELLGKNHRKLCAIIVTIVYAIGMFCIPIAAYYIKDQAMFNACLSIPSFLFMFYWWALPESPRWLVAKGRLEEAEKIVVRAAKMNGKTIPKNWSAQLDLSGPSQSSSAASVSALFRTPEMRKRILVNCFVWPAGSMLYYGLTMKADLNGGSLYVSFALSSLMELPGTAFAFFLLNVAGRKLMASSGLVLTGLFLMLNWGLASVASKDVLLGLLLASKVVVTWVDIAIYTHLPELMPTLLRNTALGFCSAAARVGAIGSAFISYWLVDTYGMATLLLPFSICSFISATLIHFILPETLGKPLPETVEDVENKTK